MVSKAIDELFADQVEPALELVHGFFANDGTTP
ncbi:uncharacterized protein Nmag_1527 [Natrialba magadii ATCC 43099]|uniref:Uncharacterized protein n=1 Tax=Natrialba magadii (strain ATCC 43099 / DSM 3394 / CCM 3739 / CIP 104546 / IAM 13178 / JCM 8861 / NBRC 102185 / NCIMB 2190 / MS3) TaxID=547559 RepID=D3STT6_NATMM|nr:uncharacterized protein Nmag_1527 [Natrialba magadii ATCC 43099]ELY23338.1 hypothetical protein C500_20161 [Natrialba magadii ATCC 43099]